jgi:23S rRNA (cytidine1920-2'-O)/16S rRNA (cytidine1409-2'-O)-methyltransferase
VPRARLDRILLDRGLVATIEEARQRILAGEVRVDGRPADKAGVSYGSLAAVTLHPRHGTAVSRGGAKLAGALDAFGISPKGRTALDIGASTGGFTQVLLERGARCVLALDVGKGQLDWSLRTDPRVIPVEGVNARFLDPAALPAHPLPLDLVTCDVSFISLRLVLPAIAQALGAGGEALVLVKPQFECPRERVAPGGVVSDPADWRDAVRGVAASAREQGFALRGVCVSPLPGAEGNREFFLWLARAGDPAGGGLEGERLESDIERAVRDAGPGSPPRR